MLPHTEFCDGHVSCLRYDGSLQIHFKVVYHSSKAEFRCFPSANLIKSQTYFMPLENQKDIVVATLHNLYHW